MRYVCKLGKQAIAKHIKGAPWTFVQSFVIQPLTSISLDKLEQRVRFQSSCPESEALGSSQFSPHNKDIFESFQGYQCGSWILNTQLD